MLWVTPDCNTCCAKLTQDIHLDDFNISNGGKDLIADATMMLAFGRRYGLIGRNGTGKTTLLRALAGHEVKGIPKNCQVWPFPAKQTKC